MSDWAIASSVASTPWALSTLKSDVEYPAAAKAWVRYGASKLTYRVDEVVSGRMTPTSPLPAAVRPFREAMMEKLVSKDVTLRPDGTVADPDEVPPVDLSLLEQAA